MPHRTPRIAPLLLGAAAVLATFLTACGASSDSLGPDVRTPDALRLLSVAANAPPLAATVVTFWAVKGRNANADIWYHAPAGQRDSSKFLEFRMGGNTLDRRPDGSTIANGDSVLITLTVTDPTHLIVEFQPSGLRFSASDPARLRMFFGECGDDLNDDGKVDGNDDGVEQQLSIWRREQPTDPWQRLSSVNVKDNKEIDANLAGFTGYALAY